MNSKTFLNDIHIYKQKNLKDKRYLVLHMMTQYFLKQMKILYKDTFFDNEYLKKIYSSYDQNNNFNRYYFIVSSKSYLNYG